MHELREATRAHVVTGPQGAASWRRRLLVSQLQVLSCWLCAPPGLRSRIVRCWRVSVALGAASGAVRWSHQAVGWWWFGQCEPAPGARGVGGCSEDWGC